MKQRESCSLPPQRNKRHSRGRCYTTAASLTGTPWTEKQAKLKAETSMAKDGTKQKQKKKIPSKDYTVDRTFWETEIIKLIN